MVKANFNIAREVKNFSGQCFFSLTKTDFPIYYEYR